MTNVRPLVDHSVPGQGRVLTIVYGYVSLNRTPPAGFDDLVWVIVPSHSSDTPYGPLGFAQEHGLTLPTHGTDVVLGFDDRGVPWVLRWSGSHS